jgi:hypothetical protein
MIFLEFILSFSFILHLIKSHTQLLFSLAFEIEKLIRLLQSVKVILNIIVVLYVFFQLRLPLSNLILVQHELIVDIIDQDPYFGVISILKEEPLLLNLELCVVHEFSQFKQWNHHLKSCASNS